MKYIGNVQSQANAEVFAVASGALGNGKTCIVNSDGTVSVVSATGGGPEAGTAVTFEDTAAISYICSVFGQNNTFTVVYRDHGNSNYGTSVVGSVSGSSISFGTPVVFNSASTLYIDLDYDISGAKYIVCYTDGGDSNKGKAQVGTLINNNAMSWGAEREFKNGEVNHNRVRYVANAKILIVYRDGSDDAHGVVGTISNTAISYGSETDISGGGIIQNLVFDSNAEKAVVFYLDGSEHTQARTATVSSSSVSFGTAAALGTAIQQSQCASCFDPDTNKIIAAYKTTGTAQGKARVGTISGTDISFGTEATFNSDSITLSSSGTPVIYDPDEDKVAISYRDAGNANRATLIFGTVSGTDISFGTKFDYDYNTATNKELEQTTLLYDTNSDKIVSSFRDEGDSYNGKSLVISAQGTNLTSENFIGFSNAAYANGQTATIQAGGAVNSGQSSLTIGQQYFVQTDGTIGTTAASPSVIAGTAVSATDIIVKG